MWKILLINIFLKRTLDQLLDKGPLWAPEAQNNRVLSKTQCCVSPGQCRLLRARMALHGCQKLRSFYTDSPPHSPWCLYKLWPKCSHSSQQEGQMQDTPPPFKDTSWKLQRILLITPHCPEPQGMAPAHCKRSWQWSPYSTIPGLGKTRPFTTKADGQYYHLLGLL